MGIVGVIQARGGAAVSQGAIAECAYSIWLVREVPCMGLFLALHFLHVAGQTW